MNTVTVVGPLKTRAEADETACHLGNKNHSVYSMGNDADEKFFVERHLDIASDTLFGYDTKEFMARQYK